MQPVQPKLIGLVSIWNFSPSATEVIPRRCLMERDEGIEPPTACLECMYPNQSSQTCGSPLWSICAATSVFTITRSDRPALLPILSAGVGRLPLAGTPALRRLFIRSEMLVTQPCMSASQRKLKLFAATFLPYHCFHRGARYFCAFMVPGGGVEPPFCDS